MRNIVIVTVFLGLLAGPILAAHAAEVDPRATTIILQKKGESVGVSSEGTSLRLSVKNGESTSVLLTKSEALRLTELIDEAISLNVNNYSGSEKANPFTLVASGDLTGTLPRWQKPIWQSGPPANKVWGFGAVVLTTDEHDGGFRFADFHGDHVIMYPSRKPSERSERIELRQISWYCNAFPQAPHKKPGEKVAVASKPTFTFASIVGGCGPGGCPVPRRAPSTSAPANVGQQRFSARPRFLGRVFGRCRWCR